MVGTSQAECGIHSSKVSNPLAVSKCLGRDFATVNCMVTPYLCRNSQFTAFREFPVAFRQQRKHAT